MIPTIRANVEEAYQLLSGVAERAADPSPAWHDVADDVFAFQRRQWMLTYGPKTDKDTRPGRNPAYMEETGGLKRAATVKGAPRQIFRTQRTYLLIEVTHGLAHIHEARGREVLAVPSRREAVKYAGRVARFILTGRR